MRYGLNDVIFMKVRLDEDEGFIDFTVEDGHIMVNEELKAIYIGTEDGLDVWETVDIDDDIKAIAKLRFSLDSSDY